jgi:hypothetical protein
MKLQLLLSMQRSSCSVKKMGLGLGIIQEQNRYHLLQVLDVYG